MRSQKITYFHALLFLRPGKLEKKQKLQVPTHTRLNALAMRPRQEITMNYT